MKKIILLNVILFSSLIVRAQSAKEQLSAMLLKKYGKDCIINGENGTPISFDALADRIIQASGEGKRVKYNSIRVTEGVIHELTMQIVDPASVKPLLEEIDFSNSSIGFYNESRQRISADDFRKILADNRNLMPAVYNAANSVIKDYYIVAKPVPLAVTTTNGAGGNSSSLSVASPTGFVQGDNMPEFSFTDISGKRWNSKDLLDKIVVVNFWFVECSPCVEEMPELNKLVDHYKNNRNVVFLSVSESSQEKIERFLSKTQFRYAHIAREQAREYLLDWDIKMFPQNIIFAKGKVSFSLTGGIRGNGETIFTLLNNAIEKSLKS